MSFSNRAHRAGVWHSEEVGWSTTSRRIWLILLFTGLLLALLVPAARLYLVPGVAVLAAGLAIWGLRVWRPPAAWAWWTVTAGVGLLAIGYVISAADAGRWPDLRREYPQPYDLIFVVGSAVVIAGAVLLLSRIHPARDRGDLLDAVMVAVGFGSLIVQLMFGSQLAQGVPIGMPPVTAVLFPLASVVLLTAVVRALLTGGVRNSTMLLLTATVVAAVASDIPRARQAASGTLTYDSILAAASVVKMALFASAVMSPGVADPRLYAPARPVLGSRARLLTVVGLAFVGPALLGIGWLLGDSVDPRVPMIATVIILVLSVFRVDGILRRIEHSATHDSLTGLLDRATFHQTLLAVAGQGRGRWYLGILDVDEFKLLNDTYGHLVGDRVLEISARRLRSTVRAEDVVGRFGGDEFAIAFAADAPGVIAARIVDTLQQPIIIEGEQIIVRVSVGICRLLGSPADPERTVAEAMSGADRAMYSIKGTDKSFTVVER